MRLALVAVAALSIVGSGCVSLFGVRGAPPPCTDTYNQPIIDTVLLGAATAIFIAAAANTDPETSTGEHLSIDPAGVVKFFAALEIAGSGISALVGYRKVSGCRRAKAAPPPPPPRDPDQS